MRITSAHRGLNGSLQEASIILHVIINNIYDVIIFYTYWKYILTKSVIQSWTCIDSTFPGRVAVLRTPRLLEREHGPSTVKRRRGCALCVRPGYVRMRAEDEVWGPVPSFSPANPTSWVISIEGCILLLQCCLMTICKRQLACWRSPRVALWLSHSWSPIMFINHSCSIQFEKTI